MAPGPEGPEAIAASVAALSAGGLPQEAAARLDQLRRTSSWTSTLSVSEFAAVRGVGFDPVGQVMGSTVDQLGNAGFGGCGAGAGGPSGMTGWTGRNLSGTGASARSRWSGYYPRVQALYAARRRAMGRLQQECEALGGDGVVGVHLTHGRFPGVAQAIEWQATGTAVRSRGAVRPRRPFLTDLTGQEFAKLLHARWVPCGLVLGVAIAVRHNDVQTWSAQRTWSNAEIPGYTEVVHEARRQVRLELEGDARRQGGEGVVLQEMTLQVGERECTSYGGTDSIAEATLIGTAVTRFHHTEPAVPAGLQILRLDQPHERVVSRRLVDQDEESPWR
jgi:uncharacterized protein YbjQ (UPF0145 family)